VVAEEPRRLGLAHHLAVEGEDVARLHLHRRRGQRMAVQRDAALGDQPLDVAARAHARPRQQLGDAFAAALAIGVALLTRIVGLGS